MIGRPGSLAAAFVFALTLCATFPTSAEAAAGAAERPATNAQALLKLYRFNAGNFLSPCTTPMAICCAGNWELGAVTPTEVSQGFGNAQAEVDNHKLLHLVFLHPTALANGTIPIPANHFVGTAVSNALGWDSVFVLQGTYPVDFANSANGEARFAVRLVRQTLPSLTTWGLIAFGLLLTSSGALFLRRRRLQG